MTDPTTAEDWRRLAYERNDDGDTTGAKQAWAKAADLAAEEDQ